MELPYALIGLVRKLPLDAKYEAEHEPVNAQQTKRGEDKPKWASDRPLVLCCKITLGKVPRQSQVVAQDRGNKFTGHCCSPSVAYNEPIDSGSVFPHPGAPV
jgi:hypothetical protein